MATGKTSITIVLLLSLVSPAGCVSHHGHLTKEPLLFDMLPYWMPLKEGNTKTFRSANPYQGIPLGEIKNEHVEVIFANELDMFPFNSIMKGEVFELISAKVDGVTYPKKTARIPL